MKYKYPYTIKLFSLSILTFLLTSWSFSEEHVDIQSVYTSFNYEIDLSFSFEGTGQEAVLEAYLPMSDDRQHIRLVNQYMANFELQRLDDENGQRLQWRHRQATGMQTIHYTFQFSGSGADYKVPAVLASMEDYPYEVQSYREATPSIPSESSFIRRKASELTGSDQPVLAILESLYTYTNNLPNQPGPAFASLFNGRKDWKNYLLIALCRAKGIPARVVNGLEIESAGAYQTRQWAELYVDGTWIPFDASAQHFAYLPGNYLTIYRGETPALQYSANLTVRTQIEIVPGQRLIGRLER